MEFEAVDEGTIEKILVSEGSEGIKVNSPIAILIDDGEKIAETKINNAPKEQAAFAENKKYTKKLNY
jgi:pyruvate/2-oxoglutarate dehydrogenase complex dihydrolipoamide acyltransferase (E2) component